MENLKTCTACGASKPATTEHFNKKREGLHSQCRACRAAARRANTATKDRENALRRARRAADPEAERAKDRARYGERKRAAVAAWRAANPVRVREISRRHYERHKPKIIQRVGRYAKANPERTRAAASRAHAKLQQSSARYRVHRSVSSMVHQCLRDGKSGARWPTLLGYDVDTLMRHLERQFERGMDWSNYGLWHIDHIRPVSSYEFETTADPDFRHCWALANLRPMWARENISKGAKITLLV